MLSTGVPTLALASAFAAFPSFIASEAGGTPSGWLQFGLGGLALGILYVVLKPLVKSQTASNARLVTSMDRIAEGQAANVEIQRILLSHAEQGALANVVLAKAIENLTDRVAALDSPRR